MAIAEHPILSEATHVSSLPPAWGTLYELTRVPPPVLRRALAGGWIRPDMDRVEATTLRGGPHIAFNSGEQEWYTPPPILAAARAWLGHVDLDPASHPAAQAVVRATRYVTVEEDGLAQESHGRVWLNPPYAATVVAAFVDKLIGEYQAGRLMAAVVLVNNCTDTRWGQRLLRASCAVCFPAGRLPFWAPGRASSSPLQGQMIAAVGGKAGTFAAHFDSLLPDLQVRQRYEFGPTLLRHLGGFSTRDQAFERCERARLLVIDDLPCHGDEDRAAGLLEELLVVREAGQRPTVITSNVAPQRLDTLLGDRVRDRLRAWGTVEAVAGPSLRRASEPTV